MSKKNPPYFCSNEQCNTPFYKMQYNCNRCGSILKENDVLDKATTMKKIKLSSDYDSSKAQLSSEISYRSGSHISTGIKEFDYFFGEGKGIHNGAIYLVYGDPGAGKSTLLAQIAKCFSDNNYVALYNSGEEIKEQVNTRFKRLFKNESNYYISSHRPIYDLMEDIDKLKPKIIVVDSIQTLVNPENEGRSGGLSQIRDIIDIFFDFCKKRNIITFIIAHVNKDGEIAGPQELPHMVDGVFYLENSANSSYRSLKSRKNRFGRTDEFLLFSMQEQGMQLVKNPSALFLEQRSKNTTGSVIIPLLEGSTPLLIELQALVVNSDFAGHPIRNVNGVDRNRLISLLAIIEKYTEINFRISDVYINIIGGFKFKDNSLDLGIIKALISSFKNNPIESSSAYIGEVGLSGEIRSVSMIESRIRECKKMGINKLYIPKHNKSDFDSELIKDLELHYLTHIKEIL